MKYPIKGVERAIEGYIKIYIYSANNYLNDKKGERYFECMVKQAKAFRQKEHTYLEEYGRNEASIKKLMKRYFV